MCLFWTVTNQNYIENPCQKPHPKEINSTNMDKMCPTLEGSSYIGRLILIDKSLTIEIALSRLHLWYLERGKAWVVVDL